MRCIVELHLAGARFRRRACPAAPAALAAPASFPPGLFACLLCCGGVRRLGAFLQLRICFRFGVGLAVALLAEFLFRFVPVRRCCGHRLLFRAASTPGPPATSTAICVVAFTGQCFCTLPALYRFGGSFFRLRHLFVGAGVVGLQALQPVIGRHQCRIFQHAHRHAVAIFDRLQ